mmetsp:Transcript_21359/g.20988  ORF Transcript_21359/g.20988 Transcript_21359/m.20988 type:complete len:163 (+) Transcript_21359:454-942(+)
MEYLNGGSLLNLVDNVGALPENILLDITHSVLHSLNYMHNKAKVSHNGLGMSQIMFNQDGEIKLNLGISQIFPKEEIGYTSSLEPSKMNLYSIHQINSPARSKKMSLFNDLSTSESERSQAFKREIFSQDIFDLGYILLVSAIGGLDLINHESLDFSNTKDA